jgi:ABC-type dipeptide/oligopeptide/nickel transport system permease component
MPTSRRNDKVPIVTVLHAMTRSPVGLPFFLRRCLGALLAIWGAVTIVFAMVYLMGNPAEVMVSDSATEEQVRLLSQQYGFDQPIYVQYARFLMQLATGDFPDSLYSGRPAIREVLMRIPNTLYLSLTAVAVGTAVGLTVGYITAVSRLRLVQAVPIRVLMLLQSIPSFFLALLLVLAFSLTLRWLPTSGSGSWRHLVLPVLTLACFVAPNVARLFRSTIREMRHEEHILTARAKGISERRVRVHHLAMNALGPVIALIGLQAGGVLAGAVVTETVFAYPGVGELLVRAVSNRDYPVVLAAVLVICIGFVIASVIVDVLVAAIDPRTQRR